MYKHTLSSKDSWFLSENRIDPLTRAPFAYGNAVVVCGNHHVFMEETYYYHNCHCPLCGNSVTLPFRRENVMVAPIRIQAHGSCHTALNKAETINKAVSVGVILILVLSVFICLLSNDLIPDIPYSAGVKIEALSDEMARDTKVCFSRIGMIIRRFSDKTALFREAATVCTEDLSIKAADCLHNWLNTIYEFIKELKV